MWRAIGLRSLGSQRSGVRSRNWDGRKVAIFGSNFAGAPMIRIGCGRWQKNRSTAQCHLRCNYARDRRPCPRDEDNFDCVYGRMRPDLILTDSTTPTAAVLRETRTIPVVFVQVGDPVGSGFVASFPHPGGNATGFNNFPPTMT